ncbi:MAG: FAD binding domain-containing protein, partial [Rhodomicrobium sp.]
MNNFDYVRPASVAGAAQALSAANATAIAGGHTLIPTLKQRLAKPAVLVDLGGIAELKGIRWEGSTIVIGATATHAEVASNNEVRQAIPALAKLAD